MKQSLKVLFVTTFIKQNKWHNSGVFGHTLKVMAQVVKHNDWKFFTAAVLHDIGKPLIAFQNEADKITDTYSFVDHEEAGYLVVKDWRFLSDWNKNIVRHHYLVRDMMKSKEKGNVSRYNAKKAIWNNLSEEMQKELKQFMQYDDAAKKGWIECLKL